MSEEFSWAVWTSQQKAEGSMSKAKEAAFDKAVENLVNRAEDLLDACNHMPEVMCSHRKTLANACLRVRKYFWMPTEPSSSS